MATDRLPPPEPPAGPEAQRQRRSPFGHLLFSRVRDAAGRPVTLDDLVRAATGSGARVSDVVAWLARARSSGLLEDLGYETGPDGRPTGPRRFRLTRAGRELPERRGEP